MSKAEELEAEIESLEKFLKFWKENESIQVIGTKPKKLSCLTITQKIDFPVSRKRLRKLLLGMIFDSQNMEVDKQ